MVGGAALAMIVPYLTTVFDIDSTTASTLISVQSIAIAIGFVVSGM